jgi:hypothetical protein
MLIGSWLRSTAQFFNAFFLIVFGTSVCALSAPFILIGQSIVALQWFPSSYRTVALALSLTGIPLGMLINTLLTSQPADSKLQDSLYTTMLV